MKLCLIGRSTEKALAVRFKEKLTSDGHDVSLRTFDEESWPCPPDDPSGSTDWITATWLEIDECEAVVLLAHQDGIAWWEPIIVAHAMLSSKQVILPLVSDDDAWVEDNREEIEFACARVHEAEGYFGGQVRPTGVTNRVSGKGAHRLRSVEAKPGEHLWVFTAAWLCKDPASVAGSEVIFDHENLLSITGPGCYFCEAYYSPDLANQPCPANPDGGMAP